MKKFTSLKLEFLHFRLFLIFASVFCCANVNAVVTITKATGGTLIPADKALNAASPAYTTLGNLIITEGATTDFSTGTNVTLTVAAPAGWTFNPLASVSASANPANDISTVNVTAMTSSLITVQITVAGTTNPDVLTVSGIQVRANEGGNVPGSANLTRGGTAVVSGCAAGAILANLSQAAGAINKLLITLPGQTFNDATSFATSGNSGSPTVQTAGTNFMITKIRATDQFFNVVTTYSGVKTLSYSGPGNGATAPSYITSVSFASGVSSTTLTTTLKKAETTTISVNDGTYSGPASSSVTVNGGAHTKFIVEAAGGGNIGTNTTGIPFNIRISAGDANNNPTTAFTGTVNITSTGTLTSGSGATASFTAGVLSSHGITISNQGSFTITATNSAGAQNGTSNSFAVNYPAASLSSINPSCITPGGASFLLIVNGSSFTGISTIRFNGSDRATTFINSSQLTATISASDISSPGVYSITVNTPGSGVTSPLIINMINGSTVDDTICQGVTYLLPDGTPVGTSGTYNTTLTNVTGCDSVVVTNLVVNPSPVRTENISICPGSTYILPDGTPENSPGTYFSLVPAPPGCDSVITTVLTFYSAPSLIATPVQIDCFGNRGSVNLFPSGGTLPYGFGPQSTTNLTAGTYNYTITDANGCSDNASATINAAPSQLNLSATPTQILCFGGTGSVSLNPTGGTPSYSFGPTSTTSLIAGTYNYQVIDNNGCVANVSATINAAPANLAATMASANTPCGTSTGSATVTVTGGVVPYTYSWNTTPVRTTRSITGLGTGVYIVTATDNNGCAITKTATIINSNSTPINITGITGICPGGSTTLTATTGFASYSWNTGETTQSITVNTADTFTVTVTNLLGCTGIKSIITHNSTFPSCTITGGTLCLNSTLILRAPTGYPSYVWSNGMHTSTSGVRNAGTYTVTVTNADHCTSTCSYTVNSPLRITLTKIDGKCSNEFKGSASVNATGGIAPYTYLWSNGNTTSSVSGLAAGSYTIRVTDSGGCVQVFTTTILANKTTYDYSTIQTTFNNNAITPGSYIWFSAVANITYNGNYPVTINFTNQNINATGLNLIPSNAKLIITNAVSQATTTFTGTEWVTTAPPNLTGNYFVSGYAHMAALPLAANLNPVKWKGVWTSSSSCLTNIQWKWSAAAYSNLSVSNAAIDVKPVDDAITSIYSNSDLAGTPENYKGNVIAGAKSIGGTDYTGTYSSLINRLPCSTPDSCNTSPRLGRNSLDEISNFIVNAYPNPFSSTTSIEFVRMEEACHLTIDVYSLFGQKVRSIFDDEVEPGVMYTVEFDASDLKEGVYIYRMVTKDDEVIGKLILNK